MSLKKKILLQTSLQTFVFEEMAIEWHKKHSECEDNTTIKSKDKTKCETNISQLRINQQLYKRKQGKSVLFQHSQLLVVMNRTGPLVYRHLTATTQACKLFYIQPLIMFTRFVRSSETTVSLQRINISQL